MNHIDRSPVDVFCQRMSALASALKSPLPTIDHTVGTWGRITELPSQLVPFINHIERSPVLVFCQSILIAGPAAAAERLLLPEPPKGRASGPLPLVGPGAGKLTLIGPGSGACKLIGPGAGTPIPVGELEGGRGAVGGDSLQERSPIP